jgi:hypothetical protein
MAKESRPTVSNGGQTNPAPAQFPIDTSQLSTVYTNFCRVNITPEELVLDFGLNTQMTPTPGAEPVKLTHRVVMNFFTAKRLLMHLSGVVQLHESKYGPLELDLQKRVRPNLGGGLAS